MVKKYACCLRGPYPSSQSDPDLHQACRQMLERNALLHTLLNSCKDQITRHHASRAWDAAKRQTNEYELVAPAAGDRPGLLSYTPVSRSFFKMWELLHDYWPVMCPAAAAAPGAPLTAAFLAEGPGGFVEAFARFRRTPQGHGCGVAADRLHGLTLMSRQRQVPHWKLQAVQQALGAGATLTVHAGADGTGDLCRLANLEHLIDRAGEGSCELVTADGGFDFSPDFNSQEESSLALVVCELYAALRLQRHGGALVLKVYDMHTTASLRLVHLVRSCYFGVRIVKPLTSRPANSEKYLVCTGFMGAAPDVLGALRRLCGQVSAGAGAGATPHLPVQAVLAELRTVLRMPPCFVVDLVRCNTVFVTRQVRSIAQALLHIHVQQPHRAAGDLDATMTRQVVRALRWAHKYGLRIAPAMLSPLWPRVRGAQRLPGCVETTEAAGEAGGL